MRKWIWATLAALPLAVVGGLAYAKSQGQAENGHPSASGGSYTCPLTGEELPCPNCCPLNQAK
jgi:hypothetical protein